MSGRLELSLTSLVCYFINHCYLVLDKQYRIENIIIPICLTGWCHWMSSYT